MVGALGFTTRWINAVGPFAFEDVEEALRAGEPVVDRGGGAVGRHSRSSHVGARYPAGDGVVGWLKLSGGDPVAVRGIVVGALEIHHRPAIAGVTLAVDRVGERRSSEVGYDLVPAQVSHHADCQAIDVDVVRDGVLAVNPRRLRARPVRAVP